MKKVIASTSLAVLIGLLVALPLNAQMAGMRGDKVANQADDIRLLILIDRMGLTTEQMQTLHDALKGVVDQASGLKDLAASFRQDLINFQGDSDQLDALIDGYRSEFRDKLDAVKEQLQSALSSLKDSLTIRQGELLRAALMPQAPGMMMPGAMMERRMGGNPSPWGDQRFEQREDGRFGTNPWEEGFRSMRPQTGFAGARPMLERGEELLARADKIVQILELKLQALGS